VYVQKTGINANVGQGVDRIEIMDKNEIKRCVVTVGYSGAHWERLKTALGSAEIIRLDGENSQELQEAIGRADVAILRRDIEASFLASPTLRWAHCDHAGIEKSALPALFGSQVVISSSAGRSAPALAEHALFFMLALSYRFADFYEAQKRGQWGVAGQDQLRGLVGKTVGIIGMGHTGQELAPRCKAFGMEVLAYRRKAEAPAGVDRIFAAERGEGVDGLLEASDYVVLAVSLSDRTHHLIGAGELARMKDTAFLVNMARGAIVDEAALLAALEGGTIAGAGLDTFATEPLPSTSPLWHAPNTLVTPHVTPQVPDRTGASLDIICENIRRYRADEKLLNQLEERDRYSGN
jgi:phosphoglycerate dehydrogenase-like enzyme